jgi:hypothetical protein
MNGFRDLLAGVFNTPPDDAPPCVVQANSFREVVSLQALFFTLTVALLAYVRSSPTRPAGQREAAGFARLDHFNAGPALAGDSPTPAARPRRWYR